MDQNLTDIDGDFSCIKSDLKEVKTTLASIDKNIAVVLERMESIKDVLEEKPTTDAIGKKISEAQVFQVVLTIGSVLAIVSVASVIIIQALHA